MEKITPTQPRLLAAGFNMPYKDWFYIPISKTHNLYVLLNKEEICVGKDPGDIVIGDYTKSVMDFTEETVSTLYLMFKGEDLEFEPKYKNDADRYFQENELYPDVDLSTEEKRNALQFCYYELLEFAMDYGNR